MAKGQRTISRLLDKSIESFILSLETINRLSVKYRAESFLILICNSWELLLKARVIQASNDPKAIYYPKKEGEKLRTLALRDCLKKVITNEADPTRLNVEWIADFRDECTHHFISKLPKTCMSLFQACVLNYHRHLKDWFNTSLSDRVPIGMMTLVYDFDPVEYDLTKPQLRRELGQETVNYLLGLDKALETVAHDLGQPKEFSIPIDYRLVLTKSTKAGDILLTTGPAGTPTAYIPVPKDAAKTHPHRQMDLI
jgi:hypothetical protein